MNHLNILTIFLTWIFLNSSFSFAEREAMIDYDKSEKLFVYSRMCLCNAPESSQPQIYYNTLFTSEVFSCEGFNGSSGRSASAEQIKKEVSAAFIRMFSEDANHLNIRCKSCSNTETFLVREANQQQELVKMRGQLKAPYLDNEPNVQIGYPVYSCNEKKFVSTMLTKQVRSKREQTQSFTFRTAFLCPHSEVYPKKLFQYVSQPFKCQVPIVPYKKSTEVIQSLQEELPQKIVAALVRGGLVDGSCVMMDNYKDMITRLDDSFAVQSEQRAYDSLPSSEDLYYNKKFTYNCQ